MIRPRVTTSATVLATSLCLLVSIWSASKVSGEEKPQVHAKPTGKVVNYATSELTVADGFSLQAWQAIKIGMKEAQVSKSLGPPLSQDPRPTAENTFQSDIALYGWHYGALQFKSPSLPMAYQYTVYFSNGAVIAKIDPYGGGETMQGLPSVPLPIAPADMTYRHYPRIADFRWQPSASESDVTYVIELQQRQPGSAARRDQSDYRTISTLAASIPHVAVSLPADQTYRWRIKARNNIGDSAWTDYQSFAFDSHALMKAKDR